MVVKINMTLELNDNEIEYLSSIRKHQMNSSLKSNTIGWKFKNMFDNLMEKNIIYKVETGDYYLSYIGKYILKNYFNLM